MTQIAGPSGEEVDNCHLCECWAIYRVVIGLTFLDIVMVYDMIIEIYSIYNLPTVITLISIKYKVIYILVYQTYHQSVKLLVLHLFSGALLKLNLPLLCTMQRPLRSDTWNCS